MIAGFSTVPRAGQSDQQRIVSLSLRTIAFAVLLFGVKASAQQSQDQNNAAPSSGLAVANLDRVGASEAQIAGVLRVRSSATYCRAVASHEEFERCTLVAHTSIFESITIPKSIQNRQVIRRTSSIPPLLANTHRFRSEPLISSRSAKMGLNPGAVPLLVVQLLRKQDH